MNKKEFLDGLREQLTGQMTEEKIQSHIRYYQEYIEVQMKNGKSESDVIGSLGTPQLIAKTLLDTQVDNSDEADRYSAYHYRGFEAGNQNGYEEEYYDQYEANEYDVTYGDDFSSTHRQENDSYSNNSYGNNYYTRETNGYVKNHTWHIDLNTWYGKLLVIAIAILVVAALIFVIGTIVPILIIAFLILTVVSYIKSRKWK